MCNCVGSADSLRYLLSVHVLIAATMAPTPQAEPFNTHDLDMNVAGPLVLKRSRRNTADACEKTAWEGGWNYQCYSKGYDAVPTDFHVDSTWLAVAANGGITTVAAGTYDKYSELIRIYLHDNNLESIPAGLFNKQKKLQRVYLYANNIRSLPKGIFDSIQYLPLLRWTRYGYGNILKCVSNPNDSPKKFSCNQCYDSADKVNRPAVQKIFTEFHDTDSAWDCRTVFQGSGRDCTAQPDPGTDLYDVINDGKDTDAVVCLPPGTYTISNPSSSCEWTVRKQTL